MILETIFWIGLIFVGYAFVGYPLVLKFVNLLVRKSVDDKKATPETFPSVSVILVVSNEASRIAKRISNLLESDYEGPLEIVVVCDGSEDGTAEAAREFSESGKVKVVVTERSGKAAGLNLGAENADGEILVFADARQSFAKDAVALLVITLLSDETVGAVSGNLEIQSSEDGAGAGIDLYWKLEKWIRHQESILDSVIGCTGAIYSLRKSRFVPIPPDTLIDDVVVPMHVITAGHRVLFEPAAKAFDPQSLEPEKENRRKVRTLAGNYQMLFRYPLWMTPIGNRCWWQLFSHKYSRLIAPFCLFVCWITSGILALNSGFYLFAFVGQTVCWLAALAGLIFRGTNLKVLTIPAGFAFLQWQSIRALFFYLNYRKSADGTWRR